jgi:hypothetical protein
MCMPKPCVSSACVFICLCVCVCVYCTQHACSSLYLEQPGLLCGDHPHLPAVPERTAPVDFGRCIPHAVLLRLRPHRQPSGLCHRSLNLTNMTMTANQHRDRQFLDVYHPKPHTESIPPLAILEHQSSKASILSHQHYNPEYDFPEADPLFGPPPRTMDRIPAGYPKLSGKKKGGGVCLMINEMWFDHNNIQELESFCSPDLEFLTIKCRPHNLPREFSSIIITVVYVPPKQTHRQP